MTAVIVDAMSQSRESRRRSRRTGVEAAHGIEKSSGMMDGTEKSAVGKKRAIGEKNAVDESGTARNDTGRNGAGRSGRGAGVHSRVRMKSSMTAGFLLAVGGAVLWGLNGTLSKYIMSHYDVTPLWFAFFRQSVAGLLFLACALWRTGESVRAVVTSWREMAHMAVISLCCVLVVQLSYLEAISWTNSATTTVLQSTSVLVVLVYTCIRARKAPRVRDCIGAALALAGVFLLATGGDPSSLTLPWQGLAWGAADALSCAALATMPLNAIHRWGNFTVNAVTFLMSALVLAVVSRPWTCWPHMDARGWALLMVSVVFGTFVSFGMYLKGTSVIGSVRGAMVGTVEPLTAAVTSVLFMGLTVTVADFAGFVAIVAMVFLTA